MRLRKCTAFLLLVPALCLGGCAGWRLERVKDEPDADRFMAGYEDDPSVVHPTEAGKKPFSYADNEGSLFNPASNGWSLWSDVVARSVGDIVTVRVSISTSAEGGATTDLSRESNVDISVSSLFGKESSIPGYGTSTESPAQLVKSNYLNEFKGDGDTKRSGKILADVSAVVEHVYPNGNMRIHGSQSTLINNENSLLTVDGIIRPTDISSNNIVPSDRIANASIEVTGRGVVSDKQRPGILARVLDWVWPL